MPPVVVPFRRQGAKSRLGLGHEVAEAMLSDVVDAAAAVGPVIVADAPGGQGRAIGVKLELLPPEPVVIVNADVPCVKPRDLFGLLGSVPPDGLALVAARDGTTNALALSSPRLFRDLYGPGSAARFGAHPASTAVDIPNLVDDVDTIADLQRLGGRLGAHTAAALAGEAA